MPNVSSLNLSLMTLAMTAGCGFQTPGSSPDAISPDSGSIPTPPTILRPDPDAVLSGNGDVFVLLQGGEIPAGRTVTGYQLCSTNQADSTIDDELECPNSMTFPNTYTVLTTPTATNRLIKARTNYDNGTSSPYTPLRSFSTTGLPVGRWPMEGNAMDVSPSGNNGTLRNGVGFGNGIDGQAIQCDGDNDYVDLGNVLALQGPLTLSAWIYGDGIPTSSDSGIINNGSLNYALTYHTIDANGYVSFYIGDGGNNLRALVSPNSWHHIVGTFDGTTNSDGMRLYVDGSKVDPKASTFATTGAVGPLWFGRYNTSFFRGGIDAVSINNIALNDASVLNGYCVTLAKRVATLPSACNP